MGAMNNPDSLQAEFAALLTGYWLTDLANFSAFFFHRIPGLNWIGFYLSDGERLRLGPFAGKPACVEIAFHRGVCGAAFSQAKPMIVDDVHEFPGHISCDPDSRSELVIPFRVGGQLIGVLDIDAPTIGRFSDVELQLFTNALESLAQKNRGLKEFSGNGQAYLRG